MYLLNDVITFLTSRGRVRRHTRWNKGSRWLILQRNVTQRVWHFVPLIEAGPNTQNALALLNVRQHDLVTFVPDAVNQISAALSSGNILIAHYILVILYSALKPPLEAQLCSEKAQLWSRVGQTYRDMLQNQLIQVLTGRASIDNWAQAPLIAADIFILSSEGALGNFLPLWQPLITCIERDFQNSPTLLAKTLHYIMEDIPPRHWDVIGETLVLLLGKLLQNIRDLQPAALQYYLPALAELFNAAEASLVGGRLFFLKNQKYVIAFADVAQHFLNPTVLENSNQVMEFVLPVIRTATTLVTLHVAPLLDAQALPILNGLCNNIFLRTQSLVEAAVAYAPQCGGQLEQSEIFTPLLALIAFWGALAAAQIRLQAQTTVSNEAAGHVIPMLMRLLPFVSTNMSFSDSASIPAPPAAAGGAIKALAAACPNEAAPRLLSFFQANANSSNWRNVYAALDVFGILASIKTQYPGWQTAFNVQMLNTLTERIRSYGAQKLQRQDELMAVSNAWAMQQFIAHQLVPICMPLSPDQVQSLGNVLVVICSYVIAHAADSPDASCFLTGALGDFAEQASRGECPALQQLFSASATDILDRLGNVALSATTPANVRVNVAFTQEKIIHCLPDDIILQGKLGKYSTVVFEEIKRLSLKNYHPGEDDQRADRSIDLLLGTALAMLMRFREFDQLVPAAIQYADSLLQLLQGVLFDPQTPFTATLLTTAILLELRAELSPLSAQTIQQLANSWLSATVAQQPAFPRIVFSLSASLHNASQLPPTFIQTALNTLASIIPQTTCTGKSAAISFYTSVAREMGGSFAQYSRPATSSVISTIRPAIAELEQLVRKRTKETEDEQTIVQIDELLLQMQIAVEYFDTAVLFVMAPLTPDFLQQMGLMAGVTFDIVLSTQGLEPPLTLLSMAANLIVDISSISQQAYTQPQFSDACRLLIAALRTAAPDIATRLSTTYSIPL